MVVEHVGNGLFGSVDRMATNAQCRSVVVLVELVASARRPPYGLVVVQSYLARGRICLELGLVVVVEPHEERLVVGSLVLVELDEQPKLELGRLVYVEALG